MKSQSETELLSRYPELDDIARRLGDSEDEAAKINAERSTGWDSGSFKKKPDKKNSDHFLISDFHKEGRWQGTIFTPKPGRELFIELASSIINSRHPDALKVGLYNGKNKGTALPTENVVVPLTETGYEIKLQEETNSEKKEVSLKGLDEGLESYKNQMQEFSNNPNYNQSDLRIQLIQKDFDTRLKDISFQAEKNKIIDQYEAQIKELKENILDHESEIEDLEEQLAEHHGTLGSLNEQIEKQQDPPTVEILAKVAQRALTGVLQTQPKFTSAITGLSEDELKGIWLKENPQLESPQANSASASFDENVESGFEGKTPQHIEAIKTIYRFCKQIPMESLKKLGTVFTSISSEAGDLDHAMCDKVIAFIYSQQLKTENQ